MHFLQEGDLLYMMCVNDILPAILVNQRSHFDRKFIANPVGMALRSYLRKRIILYCPCHLCRCSISPSQRVYLLSKRHPVIRHICLPHRRPHPPPSPHQFARFVAWSLMILQETFLTLTILKVTWIPTQFFYPMVKSMGEASWRSIA